MTDLLNRMYRIGKSRVRSFLEDGPAGLDPNSSEPSNIGHEFNQEPDHPDPGLNNSIDPELTEAFKALEVPYGSDFEICKNAYRNMARKYHSDKWQHDPEKKKTADKIMQIINPAFDTIKRHKISLTT